MTCEQFQWIVRNTKFPESSDEVISESVGHFQTCPKCRNILRDFTRGVKLTQEEKDDVDRRVGEFLQTRES